MTPLVLSDGEGGDMDVYEEDVAVWGKGRTGEEVLRVLRPPREGSKPVQDALILL